MRSPGMGSAVVVAGAGKNRYRVRCLGEGESPEPRGEGTVSIAKDWGTADLPRRAPRNTIDADGRRYTILYQNLLPQLTVGWPSAPAGQSFFLHVQADQGEARTLPARTASVQFVSGKLGEGTYTFWFEASSDPAHSSPKTTLKIDFDNAAPRAHIQEPAAGTPISGAVTVAGVAIEGASVSVSGFDMPLDAQYRFRGPASPKPGEASLAIRIAHPTHGVHYYLRRMQRGEP